MALFGGSKSNVTNLTETQNTGFSEIGGPAVAVQGEGNTIALQQTDLGAIRSAQAIAERSLEQVELAGGRTAETVSEAVRAVAESGRAETENITREALRYGAYAALGLGLFWMVARVWGKG